ncbi:MAG: hypothetical protein ACYDH3_00280 [Candidatus Aminicenantales bacterium]
MIYKLKHPNPSQGGFIAGVDFSGGVGTTNSIADANRLKDLCGCEITAIVNGEEKPVTVVGERHHVKIPGVKQEVETGPVVLRAVISETKTEGVAQVAAPSAIPTPAGEKPQEQTPKTGERKGAKKK